MKILDYITTKPSACFAPIAANDPNAEVFPLRSDCSIVIVENSKMDDLKKFEGFSMLLISNSYSYRQGSCANLAHVMLADKKEDLISAYCFLLAKGVVSLNSSGSIPYDEVKTALKLFKLEKTHNLADRISWVKSVQPVKLDEKTIEMEESEDDEQLESIDNEYYNN